MNKYDFDSLTWKLNEIYVKSCSLWLEFILKNTFLFGMFHQSIKSTNKHFQFIMLENQSLQDPSFSLSSFSLLVCSFLAFCCSAFAYFFSCLAFFFYSFLYYSALSAVSSLNWFHSSISFLYFSLISHQILFFFLGIFSSSSHKVT